MEFKLNMNIDPIGLDVSHGDDIVLMGSCFSDEMSNHFIDSGLNVLSNPFGTLFHPLAIANVMNAALSSSREVDILQRKDLYLSWDSGSKLFAFSELELSAQIEARRKKLRKTLSKAKLLVVTMGTAWGYRNIELNKIVGNCHKSVPEVFEKELSSVDEMLNSWTVLLTTLKELNPELTVVFTVSPIRHKKDGLVENNRSKSRLIELVHQLEGENRFYFPSYEVLIDELRDYRYYTSDLVHPNKDAIAYIWNAFKKYLFLENQIVRMDQVKKLNAMLHHISIHKGSEEDKRRIQNAQRKRKDLAANHPGIYWK
ncbi:MAG: GSCFA domain-containing protein [Crocinitomicaceae bacterium]|nr:GSCFA domain-containing protein [Crocinitomicaceae bacterium]